MKRIRGFLFALLTIAIILGNVIPARADAGITFSAIADCHLTNSTPRRRLELAMKEIGNQPAIDCGDIADTPAERPYQDYAKITRGSVKAVAGNHDLPNMRYFQRYVGQDQHSFVAGGVLFVGFNGDPRGFSAKWLEEQMAGFCGPIVLFNHYPIFVPKDYQSYLMNPGPMKEVLRIISQYNVVAFISGHVHESFVLKRGKTTFVGVPSLGRKGSFVRITITGENVSVSIVSVFL